MALYEDLTDKMDPKDWLGPVGTLSEQAAHLGITAHTTDAELEAIAERVRDEATGEGVKLAVLSLDHYLRDLRQIIIDGGLES